MNKILLLLGIAFSVAGIVVLIITATWSVTSMGLLSLGMVLFIIWLILVNKNKATWLKRRSAKTSIKVLSTTVTVILILGLINFLAIRYSARWDLTEDKINTLAPQSQEIVKDLPKILKVWVFDRQTNPTIKTLLEKYKNYSNNFQFEFVNPEQKIGLAEQFKVQNLGEIYLEYGDKKQQLIVSEAALGANLTESQLTNAIAKIKRDRTYNLYFLQGHGEASLAATEGGFSQAIQSIEARGYQVESLNLINNQKIPDDADLIVVAGATKKLFPAEINSLQQYLNNGGDLLLMLVPNIQSGLDSLLQEWGIESDDRLIIDASGKGNILGLGPAALIINNYGEHPITNDFRDGISIFPESRPLKVIEREAIQSTPLIITSEKTWAESNLTTEEITFNPQEDLPGPLNIAIALSRDRPTRSRMVVFGSTMFASNGWLEQQLNKDILINSINWLLTENTADVLVFSQEITNRRFNLSPLQAESIIWLAVRIMPLMALLAGGIIWWKKR